MPVWLFAVEEAANNCTSTHKTQVPRWKEARHTSLAVTGFSTRLKKTNFPNPPNGSKSPNSCIRFFVKTIVVTFGTALLISFSILVIRLCASISVLNRVFNGKLPTVAISLSVRSMQSLSYCHKQQHKKCQQKFCFSLFLSLSPTFTFQKFHPKPKKTVHGNEKTS